MKKTILFLILFTLTLPCFSFVHTTTVWEKQLNNSVDRMLVSKNYIFLINQKEVICFYKNGKQLWVYKPAKGRIGLSPEYDIEERLWLNINDLNNGNFIITLNRSGQPILKKKVAHGEIIGKSPDGKRIFIAYGGQWMHIYGGDILINRKFLSVDANEYILRKKEMYIFSHKNQGILWAIGVRDNKTLLCMRDSKNKVTVLLLRSSGDIEKKLNLREAEKKPSIAKDLLIFVNLNPKTHSYQLSAYSILDISKKWNIETGTGKVFPSFANNKIYYTNPYARSGWDPFVRGTLFEISLNGKQVNKIFKSASPFAKGAVQLFMTDYGFQYKDFFVFPTFHEVMALNKQKKIELAIPDAGTSFLIKSDGHLIFLFSIKNGNKTLKAIKMN